MNLMTALRVLLRRWYIVVPGVLLAAAAAVGVWQLVTPDYERTATQLLLPGPEIMPENGNPYLYLGGLSPAADVLVTAMSAEPEQHAVVGDRDGAELVVRRDGASSGPQLLLIVTARSDSDAAAVLDAAIERTAIVLDQLQNLEGIGRDNRIGIETIAQDTSSTPQQRTRILLAAGVGLGIFVATLLLAALIDSLPARRRRRGRRRASVSTAPRNAVDAPETAPGTDRYVATDDDAGADDHPGRDDGTEDDAEEAPADDETRPSIGAGAAAASQRAE